MKRSTSCLSYILYLIVWCGVFAIARVAYNEGVLSVYRDAFSMWFVWCGIILCAVCFSSVLWLKLFKLKESARHIFSYVLFVLFCVLAILFVNLGEQKFDVFSTENWIDFPERRLTMYEDFIEWHSPVGKNAEELVDFLGAPDEMLTFDNVHTYVYSCHHGNSIYFIVDTIDHIVKDTYVTE